MIILRICLLTILIVSAVISVYETDYVVTPVMFSLLAVLVAAELHWHLGRTRRMLSRFLLSIKHHDFSRYYKIQSADEELHQAFDLITKSFEDLETQKHADYRLLQTVSEHIKIGLACYSLEGQVTFSNKAFKEMLRMESFAKMDTLARQHPEIHKCLIADKPTPEMLIATSDHGKFLLKTEAFTLQDQGYRLASLYDIKSTLDTNELESYQKLMKVMTHEVMNSATPVLSLIQVVNKKLIKDEQVLTLAQNDQKNIAFSLKAIETRTASILKFVEAYRKINKPITPVRKQTTVHDLIAPVVTLLAQPSGTPVAFENAVEAPIYVDVELMSQTLINLLKNAMEATSVVEEPAIAIEARIESDRLIIAVEDNGSGISAAQQKEIFVPFFTTKAEGSGVGLALSRKIINAHGGSLNYQMTDQNRTRFTILLPGEVFLEDVAG